MERQSKKKNKKFKIFIGLLIVLSVLIIVFLIYLKWRGTGFYRLPPSPTEAALPGEYRYPEDAEWHTIDNKRFGIDNTGGNARATTDGINEALQWARSQGFVNVKFADGVYSIQCNWNDRFIAPDDGILVPSGLTIDLGASIFKIVPNDYPAYCIFGVINQSDVTILGGTLIGDRDEHVYSASADSPTHEWGFGICVSAASDVLIQGVTIRNTTGDGIMVEGSYQPLAEGGKVSSNVRVYDCDISNCRRQGISIIGALDSEIAENRIYDIGGTDPQYGIDVEPEFDHGVDDLKIHDNLIYGCKGGAVSCYKGSGYSVYSNICKGNNIIAVNCTNVKIYGNHIESSYIRVYRQASQIELYNNQYDLLSRLVIGK